MLHQVTYVLVSLAALVYICQTLLGGLSGAFHRTGTTDWMASNSAPATVAPTVPQPPASYPTTQAKSETVFGPLQLKH
jgi:hypothetical protein